MADAWCLIVPAYYPHSVLIVNPEEAGTRRWTDGPIEDGRGRSTMIGMSLTEVEKW